MVPTLRLVGDHEELAEGRVCRLVSHRARERAPADVPHEAELVGLEPDLVALHLHVLQLTAPEPRRGSPFAPVHPVLAVDLEGDRLCRAVAIDFALPMSGTQIAPLRRLHARAPCQRGKDRHHRPSRHLDLLVHHCRVKMTGRLEGCAKKTHARIFAKAIFMNRSSGALSFSTLARITAPSQAWTTNSARAPGRNARETSPSFCASAIAEAIASHHAANPSRTCARTSALWP